MLQKGETQMQFKGSDYSPIQLSKYNVMVVLEDSPTVSIACKMTYIIPILFRYLQDEGQRRSAIVGPENNQISSGTKWTVKTFSV